MLEIGSRKIHSPVARFAPGGALAASAGDDGSVRVWSVAERDDDDDDDGSREDSGSLLASLHVGERAVGALAWDPLASASIKKSGGGVLYVGTRDASNSTAFGLVQSATELGQQ